MARREKTITIDDRGQSLTFKIREMPATQTERWIARALLLLGAAGVKIPDGDIGAAIRYILNNSEEFCKGVLVKFDDAFGLADDLLRTCSRVTGKVIEPCDPETIDDYVVDARTLFKLRQEALGVCFGFFGEEKSAESRRAPSIKLQERQG